MFEAHGVTKATATETTVFVYSAGKLVAEYSTKLATNPSTNFMTTDHLSTPRVISNELGQVKSRRDFMPFGEELTINVGERSQGLKYGNADEIRQKFTGYQKDSETQLDFAEARMYENRLARFTAVDPLLASGKSANPQSFNRYVYVQNSPLILTDSSGMIPDWVRAKGEVFFDSRVTSQEDATNLYGADAKHYEIGREYTANDKSKVQLLGGGDFTQNGIIQNNGDRARDSWYSPSQTGDVRQNFWTLGNSVTQGADNAGIGAAKGIGNTEIDGINFGVSHYWDRWGLSSISPPPQIGRYRYDNDTQGKYGTTFQTGLTLAPAVLTGVIAKPPNLSIAPRAKELSTGAKMIRDWLGPDAKGYLNKSGDLFIMSSKRKFRVDFRNPGNDLPHMHLEEFLNGKWKDAIRGVHRIYPDQ